MLIKGLNEIIVDAKGVELKDGTTPMRYVDALYAACTVFGQDDHQIAGKERFELGKLAWKLAQADDEIELEVGDVEKIKQRVGKLYAPVVVFAVWQMLESK